jgi:hypothetical protein
MCVVRSEADDGKAPCPDAELPRARAALYDIRRVCDTRGRELFAEAEDVDVELRRRHHGVMREVVLIDPSARRLWMAGRSVFKPTPRERQE